MANFVVDAKAKSYYWKGDSWLSIKYFVNGNASYRVNDIVYDLDDRNYLLLNEHTDYELTINSKSEVSSLCVFFDPDFVSNCLGENSCSEEQLLAGITPKMTTVPLVEKLNPAGDNLWKGIQQLHNAISSNNKLLVDESYYQLFTAIIENYSNDINKAKALNLVKKSTRLEIYKRLTSAKYFIDENYKNELRLKQIVDVAMMSPNQFLRHFKQLYGQTPFQYIATLKIKQAMHLLKNSDLTITEILQTLGNSSLSNFSHYFKLQTGKSPSDYKKGNI